MHCCFEMSQARDSPGNKLSGVALRAVFLLLLICFRRCFCFVSVGGGRWRDDLQDLRFRSSIVSDGSE